LSLRDEDLKLLYDLEQAAQRIIEFTQGRTYADYLQDAYLRSAVERQFEIIGEALTRLRRDNPLLADKIREYKKIIAFRNVLSHGYDVIQHQIVWQAVVDKIPPLLEDVLRIRNS
jgi:uncharacterized protein with HEPN domain